MTQKTKHTPGPWEPEMVYSKPFGNSPVAIRSNEFSTITNQIFGDSEENAIANARLIAAAPDMLEALELMLVHCSNSTTMEAAMSKDIAIAAIAKARGEKS